MPNENEVAQPEVGQEPGTEPTPEPVVADETVALRAQLEKETEARRQLTARAQKAEADKKALEARLNASKGEKNLDVEDYIDISASLEGLDQKEKERLAREHKLSGQPLSEIRKDPDFLLWQEAYRQKVEKEKQSLKPTGTQADTEREMSFQEKLSNASMADKEKLLSEAGLYRTPRPRADRQSIGPK